MNNEGFKVVKLSRNEYNAFVDQRVISSHTLYIVSEPDGSTASLYFGYKKSSNPSTSLPFISEAAPPQNVERGIWFEVEGVEGTEGTEGEESNETPTPVIYTHHSGAEDTVYGGTPSANEEAAFVTTYDGEYETVYMNTISNEEVFLTESAQ